MNKSEMILVKIESAMKLLDTLRFNHRRDLPPWKIHRGDDESLSSSYDDPFWEKIDSPLIFRDPGQAFSLCTTITVSSPRESAAVLVLSLGKSTSLEALQFLYGPEALLYIDGIPYHGVDPNHREIHLPGELAPHTQHTVVLQGWTGIKEDFYPVSPPYSAEINQDIQELLTLYKTIIQTVRNMPASDPVYTKLVTLLNSSYNCLDLNEPIGPNINDSIGRTLSCIRTELEAIPSLKNQSVAAIGHAHLDIAWLWDVPQAIKKAARTFSNVLRLMEDYPEFIFSCSQPQLYVFMEQHYPKIFREIQKRVEEGRWELMGGMWVEADCNLSGAEALARQFMLGRRYFSEHFSTPDTEVLWLPDVFGYSWQLPQIMKESEISGFVTAKLSWNQFNRMPHESFWWKGLDGTDILTSLISTKKPGWWGATYSGEMNSEEVLSTWESLQDKDLCDELLMPYGLGDGGGGPTREMLENAAVMKRIPGLPEINQTTVESYFKRLQDKTSSTDFPVWNGELYLELHRGTYTTQAKNKRLNRKCEFQLHDAEFLASWAAVKKPGFYPREELKEAWSLLCLNQFHDILPGSAIHEVYEQSTVDYRKIADITDKIIEESLGVLDGSLPSNTAYVLYNPTSFTMTQIVELPDYENEDPLYAADGKKVLTQKTEKGLLLHVRDIPPYGYTTFSPESPSEIDMADADSPDSGVNPSDVTITAGDDTVTMENSFLRLIINGRGELLSLFDKEVSRECIPDNQRGNLLEFFEDRPMDWDAWDIDIYYEEKPLSFGRESKIRISEHGPLRVSAVIEQRIQNSTFLQHISLSKESRRIDFKTECDWQETHVLLKAVFPTTMLSPSATYDIQWGNVERPTHRNTSWDRARFETCAHKWADLSEGDYGVSLLNDCKYGYSVKDHKMALTLLRSPTFPDKTADKGHHEFTYSLLPHKNDWRGITAGEAYGLNDPCIIRRVETAESQRTGTAESSLVCSSYDGVVIETVKMAEDNESLVIRMYEYKRTKRNDVQIILPQGVKRALRSNILEKDLEELEFRENKVSINPYQILTLKVELETD